jgi:hypothetical protein
MLTQSMGRVGLIDITVGNAARLGASQRSTTRRCASHHIPTQRVSRWDIPAALARLARCSSTCSSGDGMAFEGDAVEGCRRALCARVTIMPKGASSSG